MGGDSGKFALWLDGDFRHGSSHPSSTFDNPQLSSEQDFEVLVIEVWGFEQLRYPNRAR